MTAVATILGEKLRTFQRLSATFSRPILAMFTTLEFLWRHIKTINSLNVILLIAVEQQLLLQ